jgi:hypothetical protein
VQDLAAFSPLKLALWCLVIFAMCFLVLVVVCAMWFLGKLGYGPEFFILLMKFLKPSI